LNNGIPVAFGMIKVQRSTFAEPGTPQSDLQNIEDILLALEANQKM
jgi:hypothetical protein